MHKHKDSKAVTTPEKDRSTAGCCSEMSFAIKHAIIRTTGGFRFGPDVLPEPLTKSIKFCPWCGHSLLDYFEGINM